MNWKTNFQVFAREDGRNPSYELAIIPFDQPPCRNDFGWGSNRKLIIFSGGLGGNTWRGFDPHSSEWLKVMEEMKAFVQAICDAMNAAAIPVPKA